MGADLRKHGGPYLREAERRAAGGGAVEGVAVAHRVRHVELRAVQRQQAQTAPPSARRFRDRQRTGHLPETENGELWQMDAADRIDADFDEGLTYINDNGNTAISKEVLAEFRKLSEGTVVWERGSGLWRRREEYDPEGRRQAD